MTDTETVTGEVVGTYKGLEGYTVTLPSDAEYKLVRVSGE